jgi:hypothetical protein
MGTRSYRTFLRLDAYELAMLRKLKKELSAKARKEGKSKPTMVDIIRGCIRTAIHTVYGQDYLLGGLMTEEQFKQDFGQIDPSLLEDE